MELDRHKEAFLRLLADGRHGGQSKIDALVALAQRTVHVATWSTDGSGYRTLTNSNGQSALPIFTDESLLLESAPNLGWQGTSTKEIGAREALRHAVAHNLSFVVVDIGSDHALEIDQEEIEPLLTPQARRESSGPFAGVGRVSSKMMQAVKPTPPPGDVMAPAPEELPPQAPPRTPSPTTKTESRPPPPMGMIVTSADATQGAKPTATFGSGSSVTVGALEQQPPDELLEALAGVLRDYPEVEWAALANVSRGPASAAPTVGLKVDASFRQRVGEIIQGLRTAGDAQGAALDVLLLDDALVMRTARSEGLLFYPWKRR